MFTMYRERIEKGVNNILFIKEYLTKFTQLFLPSNIMENKQYTIHDNNQYIYI